MVAAFSLDISVSLSLPCTFVVYLRRWSFLEDGHKIEELVRGIRTRKGLKVGTILGLFFPQLLTF